MYQSAPVAPLYPPQTSLEPAIKLISFRTSKKFKKTIQIWWNKINCRTWLRTSESEADDTKVIARPFVPNLPALPTCYGFFFFKKHNCKTFQQIWCAGKESHQADMLNKFSWIYPVQVSVSRVWHVIVNNNVDTFNINTPANQISGNKNPFMTLLETLVAHQPANGIHSAQNISLLKLYYNYSTHANQVPEQKCIILLKLKYTQNDSHF